MLPSPLQHEAMPGTTHVTTLFLLPLCLTAFLSATDSLSISMYLFLSSYPTSRKRVTNKLPREHPRAVGGQPGPDGVHSRRSCTEIEVLRLLVRHLRLHVPTCLLSYSRVGLADRGKRPASMQLSMEQENGQETAGWA